VLPEDKWLAEQIDELKSESKAAEEELVAEVKDAPKKRARKANS
jgi:hypothetical protein